MRLALYNGKGLISTLIRWQSRGGYSHASVLQNDGSVIESREGGVRRMPSIFSTLDKGESCDVFNVATTPDQDEVIEKFLAAQVGKKYDYLGVARFVTRRPDTSKDRWFCSELVFAAFEVAQIYLFVRTSAWEVPPEMLARSPLATFSRTVRTA